MRLWSCTPGGSKRRTVSRFKQGGGDGVETEQILSLTPGGETQVWADVPVENETTGNKQERLQQLKTATQSARRTARKKYLDPAVRGAQLEQRSPFRNIRSITIIHFPP